MRSGGTRGEDVVENMIRKPRVPLDRLHALVLGCGLGKLPAVLEAARELCAAAAGQGSRAFRALSCCARLAAGVGR